MIDPWRVFLTATSVPRVCELRYPADPSRVYDRSTPFEPSISFPWESAVPEPMSKKSMRVVSVFVFQVIDSLVYLFVVFNQLMRPRLITISYLLVISENAKSAAQVFRVLVRLRAHAAGTGRACSFP